MSTSTMVALTDSRKAAPSRSTEHDAAGTVAQTTVAPESGTRLVGADCTETAREKFLAPARASSRYAERPVPMFDARDVQKADPRDLAVVSCETGGALYHFRSGKKREAAL